MEPEIEIEIRSTEEVANLRKREADVAICFVIDRKTLPFNDHGLKGPELASEIYLSRQLRRNGALSLLTHGETRKTKRVRLFMEVASERLAGPHRCLRDYANREIDAEDGGWSITVLQLQGLLPQSQRLPRHQG